MAQAVTIRLAGNGDAALLNRALRSLSEDLGDTHAATVADIERAGFGPDAVFRAQLALGAGEVLGAAVYSPIYSTTRAAAGCYVSDLWVAAPMRGTGLGPRLLAALRDDAGAQWGAAFIRLAVYAGNPRAIAFYERMGFVARRDEMGMLIEGAALERIGEKR